MAEQLRHPAWCNQSVCVATLTEAHIGGEHLSTLREITITGDEDVRIRLWLVGVPMEQDGMPTRASTFVALDLMHESREALYLLDVEHARMLSRNVRELVGAVAA